MSSLTPRAYLTVLAAAVSVCGSAHLGPSASTCSPERPRDAVATTPERIDSLTGRFRVVLVTTSYVGKRGVEREQSQLELFHADSATRVKSRSRSIGHSVRRDLRLIGVHEWGPNKAHQAAEWDDGTLFLGCRDCYDGSPDRLHIEAVSPNGFWGTWVNDQSGIARLMDDEGKPAPDPAGYFCAVRQ